MATHELFIYDEIGPDYWGMISGKSFIAGIKELKADDGDTLVVRINSPGGDVFEAKAIGEAISRWKGPTVAEIDALAASAATTIAIRADEVRIAETAMFMIHNAWTVAMGDSYELRRVAGTLEAVSATIIDDYERKTGMERQKIVDLMNDETWMTANEAVEYGFADSVGSPMAIAARVRPGLFHNMPEALKPQPRHEHQTTVRSPELQAYKISVLRKQAGV